MSNDNPRLFGTDGIRGTAGVYPLDAPTVRRLGAALVRALGHRAPHFLIGRDTRESGGWIETDPYRLTMDVEDTVRTAMATTRLPMGAPMTFLQLGGAYHVAGHVGDRTIDFTTRGAAETFRHD